MNLKLTTYVDDHFRSPSSGVGDESEGEEDGGEGLQRPADGEHRAADAVAAADRLKQIKITDETKFG